METSSVRVQQPSQKETRDAKQKQREQHTHNTTWWSVSGSEAFDPLPSNQTPLRPPFAVAVVQHVHRREGRKNRPNPWETFCAVPCCCSLSLYLLCYVSAHPAVQQHASECIDCILLEFNRPNVLFCVSVNCCCWGPKNQFWAIPIWPWPRCICSKALEATGTQQQQKVANVCVWRIAHRWPLPTHRSCAWLRNSSRPWTFNIPSLVLCSPFFALSLSLPLSIYVGVTSKILTCWRWIGSPWFPSARTRGTRCRCWPLWTWALPPAHCPALRWSAGGGSGWRIVPHRLTFFLFYCIYTTDTRRTNESGIHKRKQPPQKQNERTRTVLLLINNKAEGALFKDLSL